jgi:hypothetical protein
MGAITDQVTQLSATVETTLGELQARVESAPPEVPPAKVALLRAQLSQQGGTLRATVAALRDKVAAVEQQVNTHIDQVTQALTAVGETGTKTALSAKAKLEAGVARAQASLDAIPPQATALQAKLMGTIDAAESETGKLRDKSTQLIAMLTSVRDKGLALLAAIPADKLPKPLVTPTKTAIDKGTTQGTQQLEQLATRASGQLEQLQQQVAAQIDRVSQQATGQVATARSGLVAQIQSIVSATLQAAGALQQEVEQVIAAGMQQVETMKAQSLAQIDQLRAAAASEVQAASGKVQGRLAGLKAEIEAGVASGA